MGIVRGLVKGDTVGVELLDGLTRGEREEAGAAPLNRQGLGQTRGLERLKPGEVWTSKVKFRSGAARVEHRRNAIGFRGGPDVAGIRGRGEGDGVPRAAVIGLRIARVIGPEERHEQATIRAAIARNAAKIRGTEEDG